MDLSSRLFGACRIAGCLSKQNVIVGNDSAPCTRALPEARNLLMDFYKQTLGDQMNPEKTHKKIVDENRVLIRIEIEGVGPQNRG